MVKRRFASALAGTLLAALTAPSFSGADLAGPSAASLEGPFEIGVELTGSRVVPGPGTPTGSALMGIDTDRALRRVCFQLDAEGLGPMKGASLHKGGPGEVGPSRLVLFDTPEGVPGDGLYRGCVDDVRKRLLRRIAKPRRREGTDDLPLNGWSQWNWSWYAEVRTDSHPDGAVRGQLGAGTPCPSCYIP